MRRIFIFTALGTGLAIASGVGLSMAHTMGLFAPAQADWLTTSRVVTPTAPAIVETMPVVVRAPALPLDAPRIVAPQPVEVRAPMSIVTPLMRPAPVTPVQTVQAPAPRITPQAAPDITQRLSTRQTPQAAVPPVVYATPTENGAALDGVWLLGVYR